MPEPSSFDPVQILHDRFSSAIASAYPDLAGADPAITPGKNPKFGDFQCNAAMALGKQLALPPRDVAAALVAKVDLADLAEPLTPASIAGPGFINITLRPASIAQLLDRLDSPDLGLPPAQPSPAGERQTIVVDLCGVNLAKQMHVGHLRATVIGDTLARVFTRLGHDVRRQNHVGDWGLNIAMVTARVRRLAAAGLIDLAKLTLDDLDLAYKAAQRECDADEKGLAFARAWGMGPKVISELEAQVAGALEAESEAKATLVRLQAHDPDVFAVWQRISDLTMEACLDLCARLNALVLPEHSAGESSYSTELAPMVDDLVKRAVAEESDGALVIRVPEIDEPTLIRKSDGGFIYATTDVAAVRRRVQQLGADRVVYAVDARQALHFRQVFAAAAKAGFTLRPHGPHQGQPASLEHAAFGMMLGSDGKPFKTRAGASAKLADLIEDAEEKAFSEVSTLSPELPDGERRSIARAVATAAIRYADLSSERTKDYVFSLERMIAFQGNTGPYLLYALVRIRSIFRKAAEQGLLPAPLPAAPPAAGSAPGDDGLRAHAFAIPHAAEKALALSLLRYPGVTRQVAQTLLPHRLCQYLYELAGAFAAFFEACPVLKAPDEPTRFARLRLCALTERVLADGLQMLGIPLVDRM